MQATNNIEVGQQAPDFALKGPGGQPITLSEYRGKKNVVLAFFPLAFSPACSNQLPTIERQARALERLDAVVLGISVDNHYANEAFARHLGLSFPLLSDFNRETSAAYGVLNPKRGHSGRALFVIDKQGRVVHKEVSLAPGDPQHFPHNDRVLEVLEGLSRAGTER